tara:strand:- start:4718 stop:4924 length:207 start_codon:yes stop_codon:yes gene_type:complete
MNDELMLALGRLEGKVDSLISRQSVVDEEMRKFDSRLRSVEQSRSWLVGAAASVGALVSAGFQWITKG